MNSFESPRPDADQDFPGSLYGDSAPPPDEEALAETRIEAEEEDEARVEGPPPTPEEAKEEIERPAAEELDVADRAEAGRIAREEADRASGEDFPPPVGEK